MKRKLFAPLLLALAVVASLLSPLSENARSAQRRRRQPPPPPTRRPASINANRDAGGRAQPQPTPRARQQQQRVSTNLDARLNALANAYLQGYYDFNPTTATALGLHQHDAALESRSRERVAREVRRLRAALAELARLPEWRLSAEARYDYRVLQSHARASLLELEDIRMWQRDPNVYNRLVSESIDNILKRNYAPIEGRLDALLQRERQIARLLNEARANLDSPPRIYTETAISQARGSVDYFTRVVPQMFERAGGSRLSAARRAEFNTANEMAVAALSAFVEWLERDLLPRSTGEFSIGAENFRRKLLYEEMVEDTPAALIREGERELRRTQDEMRALAEEIAPGRGVSAALEVLGREHPTADGLVGETRAELDRIRAFVRTQQIMTPPSRENLIVAETPEYARSTSFASMDTPGAFERVATEAYYYVTPPDPAWDARRREEHLSFYNRYSLPVISMHEVYPGHYYQLLAAKNSPSRVRAVLGSASFIEGWGHYAEQMMLDEGFGGNNPKLRLAQQNLALLRLCRYLVGLRMHTQGMTYQQGVEFFMREGFQARVNAEREARRGTQDPTYLVYTLGKMEILKLREEWRQQMGASFRLGEFHDRLLSYGSPPIPVIRMAMLGDAGAKGRQASAEEPSENESRPVDFSVLAMGTASRHEGAGLTYKIKDPGVWESHWRTTIGSQSPVPEVNFNTQFVLVVYQGRKTTGGYSVSVSGARFNGTVLAVYVTEQRPASEDRTTQVITSPFVAVSLPRQLSDAHFELQRESDASQGRVEQNATPRKGFVKSRGRRTKRGGQ